MSSMNGVTYISPITQYKICCGNRFRLASLTGKKATMLSLLADVVMNNVAEADKTLDERYKFLENNARELAWTDEHLQEWREADIALQDAYVLMFAALDNHFGGKNKAKWADRCTRKDIPSYKTASDAFDSACEAMDHTHCLKFFISHNHTYSYENIIGYALFKPFHQVLDPDPDSDSDSD